MNNIKYAAAIPVAAMLFASLTACGSADAGSGSGKFTIAEVPGRTSDSFYLGEQCGAKAAAKKLGVNLDIQGPNEFDASQQIQVLNAVLAKKPDGLLISATDAQALKAPIEAAAAQGTKVIELDSYTDASDVVARIGSNDEESGRIAARTLAKGIGEKGAVLTVGLNPGIASLDDRQKGFTEELKKYPGIQDLGVQYSGDSPDKIAQIVNATLQAHPDLKGIMGSGLFTTQGIASAVKNAGKSGAVKTIGFDATQAQVDAIKDGSLTYVVSQSPRNIGAQGVEDMVKTLKGDQVEKRSFVGTVVFSTKNIGDPKLRQYIYGNSC